MKAPLEMPTSGAAFQHFEPQRVDHAAPEGSGRVGGVQDGFPLWLGIWTIGKIGAAKSDELRSFLAELRGAIRTFYGRDLGRPYPKAYPDGFSLMTKVDGTPFTGAAASWSDSVDSNDDQLVTLTGLPAGLVLTTGDYVGFKWDDPDFGAGNKQRRTVARVVRGGGDVADASGVLEVKVEPAIPTLVPGTAIAHLDTPACVMRLMTEQTKLDSIDRRLAVRGGTIVAVQDLR